MSRAGTASACCATALFHPAPPPALERRPDVSAVLDAASLARHRSIPRSALWLLRECYSLSYGAIELYRA